MSNVRPPAVAGMFYPANPVALSAQVEQLLSAAERPSVRRPKGLIVPHAGYVYSGPVAASAYARLAGLRDGIERVLMMGPSHRAFVRGLAVPRSDSFATPLGRIPVDREAIDRVRSLPGVIEDDSAHAMEHSLEVQLPFLQRVLGSFTLAPFAVGDARIEDVAGVIEALAGADETLVVISSDLSHYHPYSIATRIDSATAERIRSMRSDIDHEQACGATPINGALLWARRHALRVELLDLRNSGDTSGDRSRVVGYAAFAFYRESAGE
jgi:hypothetical protein